jgi:two-component system, cell cycle sensor histidine kinase and response regulator CckA
MVAPTTCPPERVILVVDDEDLVRQLTIRALTEAGFRVLEARSGAEALSLLATLGTNVIWLVVSDIMMPQMTGEQLAATITREWPAVQVLLISGQGGPRSSFTGHFLPKPFTLETLVTTVRELLPALKASVS